MVHKEDWTAWYAEKDSFASRDTEGFSKDLHALKAHILKLQAVCPKDSAGWPVGIASRVIYDLHKDYTNFCRYLAQFKE